MDIAEYSFRRWTITHAAVSSMVGNRGLLANMAEVLQKSIYDFEHIIDDVYLKKCFTCGNKSKSHTLYLKL